MGWWHVSFFVIRDISEHIEWIPQPWSDQKNLNKHDFLPGLSENAVGSFFPSHVVETLNAYIHFPFINPRLESSAPYTLRFEFQRAAALSL